MQELKITINGANGGQYLYNSNFSFPRLGEKVNFTFTSPPILGTVTEVNWTHVNEVTLTVV